MKASRPGLWFARAAKSRRFGEATDPRRGGAAADPAQMPAGTDWCWRPALWRDHQPQGNAEAPVSGHQICDGTAIWHDGAADAVSLGHDPAENGAQQGATQKLTIRTHGFRGSYLSLAIDLPPSFLIGLIQAHILRLEMRLHLAAPVGLYGRLNVRHGPNTDELVRHIQLQQDQIRPRIVEFDLALTDMNEHRLEKVWLDLIFDKPETNLIEIGDFLLSRHLRANF